MNQKEKCPSSKGQGNYKKHNKGNEFYLNIKDLKDLMLTASTFRSFRSGQRGGVL